MFLGVVGINGKMGSGKDYLVKQLTVLANQCNAKVVKLQFKDGLLEVANFIHNLAGLPRPDWEHKTPEQRQFLQSLGTDTCRAYLADIWIRIWQRNVEKTILATFMNPAVLVVVPDMRFPNEMSVIEDNYTSSIVRVHCNEDVREMRLHVRDGAIDRTKMLHISETALDDVTMHTFDNSYDGPEAMQEAANWIWNDLHEKAYMFERNPL